VLTITVDTFRYNILDVENLDVADGNEARKCRLDAPIGVSSLDERLMRSSVRLVPVVLAALFTSACGRDVVSDPLTATGLYASASSTPATGADLQASGSSDNGSPVVNTAFTYTYQVKNAGPDSAVNTTFSDTAHGGVTFTAAFSNVGACSITSSTTVFCELGTMRKGGQATIKLTAFSYIVGSSGNVGVATSAAPDPSPANNAVTVFVNLQSGSNGGGSKVLPVIVSAYSSLPAVFNGGGYNITGSGTAPGIQFTATQSGGWSGVFASLHGQGLPGQGVCWLNADDINNPDNPGPMLEMTSSNAIPATGGALTFFAAPVPISIVAGQKYWLFCRGLGNQVWGGLWDFASDNTLFSIFASGAGSLAFADGPGRVPAFQINVTQ
jgi:uncharacterized repeat protein (TIGR01451 family)